MPPAHLRLAGVNGPSPYLRRHGSRGLRIPNRTSGGVLATATSSGAPAAMATPTAAPHPTATHRPSAVVRDACVGTQQQHADPRWSCTQTCCKSVQHLSLDAPTCSCSHAALAWSTKAHEHEQA